MFSKILLIIIVYNCLINIIYELYYKSLDDEIDSFKCNYKFSGDRECVIKKETLIKKRNNMKNKKSIIITSNSLILILIIYLLHKNDL